MLLFGYRHMLIYCYSHMLLICYRHILVVFGGVKGLEAALEADDKLEVDDPSELFTSYLNTCPVQGSGTIRTEVSRFIITFRWQLYHL